MSPAIGTDRHPFDAAPRWLRRTVRFLVLWPVMLLMALGELAQRAYWLIDPYLPRGT